MQHGQYPFPQLMVTGAVTADDGSIYSIAHTQAGLRAIKLETTGSVDLIAPTQSSSA